ncbi:MAG: C4-dicarboxylate ABC transporter substrate-binding protein [Gammaproteobacteria bacterium]|nr:C4-dicarboxylate ABC transporter substrate-binding protein [Gammaproteobacteria bacterium]
MKKQFVSIIAGAILGLSTVTAQAADVTLRISLQVPLKNHLGQNLLSFKNKVEKASNGEIEVKIYDSAQLYKDKEVPAAVGSGSIEMGVASLTRFVGDAPVVDVFYLPFMFNTEEKISKAVARGSAVRSIIDGEIAKTGSTVLWWQAYGSAIFLSKGKPIKTPADMEGRKVRVFGKTLGQFVTAAGGAPTLISGSEQFLAYQRGTVDIGMTGVSGVKSRKLWDVMDTITVSNNADIEFIVLINTKFWSGLSDAHKAIINASAQEAELEVRNAVAQIEADAYKASEENGMTVYRPTAGEMAQWKAISQPVIDQYLEKNGALGQKVIDAANNL